jgi:hypothetical protein
MAVFIEVALGNLTNACTARFADVLSINFFCDSLNDSQTMKLQGVVAVVISDPKMP